MRRFKAYSKNYGFIFLLFIVVLLAYLFPAFGTKEGPLKAGLITKAGIILIFFIQGLSLNTRELWNGIREWRLHVFIQAWIFLVAPLFFLLAAFLFRRLGMETLFPGLIFLGLLPTTISSSVALTSVSGGNVPGAVFNTTISNLAGVFWVPLGCVLFFSSNASPQSGLLVGLLWKLSYLIVIPLIIGQLVRPKLSGKTSFKNVQPRFKNINYSIILFIVYAAFAESFQARAWTNVSGGELLISVLVLLIIMGFIHYLAWIVSSSLTDLRGRITAVFCGSQKTLAAGAPMAMAIFESSQLLSTINPGILLLPLMIYHSLQLLLGAWLAPRLERVVQGS